MRYAVTLWFIDRIERDRRILLDQKEEEGKCVIDSNSSLLIPQNSPKVQHLPQLELLSSDLTSNTQKYHIKYPDKNGYRVTQLLVNSTEIIVKAEDDSFETFHIITAQPIVEQDTVAKYHKKNWILSLTVRFVLTSGN